MTDNEKIIGALVTLGAALVENLSKPSEPVKGPPPVESSEDIIALVLRVHDPCVGPGTDSWIAAAAHDIVVNLTQDGRLR
jgi:hypothetical protein